MKQTLRLEELFMLALGIFLFHRLDYSWWWFISLFLAPDIGMIGYAWNTKAGAITYNVFHHKGIAIAVYLLGFFMQIQTLQMVGAILFAHASFDRMLGYGLKYKDSFKNTHLGTIGKE